MDKFLEEFYALLGKYNAEIDTKYNRKWDRVDIFIRIFRESVNEEEAEFDTCLEDFRD